MATCYFFFGTLMDVDVLELVVDRPVDPSVFMPARLDGFRRVRVAWDSFPMLVHDRDGSVDGMVFTSRSSLEDDRIRFFEDYDYDLAPCRPIVASGKIDAVFCGTDASVEPTEETWTLAGWAERYKPGFLELSAEYMDCFGRMTPDEAEPVWERGRLRLVAAGLL